ncbi:hypothetical protein [Sporichthya sp.]|uniref:hypothetical protein n=1 Tax=Sporichthya sp. TaxID=65475 RepID=UPI0017A919FD|nr:hypothetical protein [Sporichthya sp.]MBA3745456.1 hypothetical protein [Sporichthya sp.]
MTRSSAAAAALLLVLALSACGDDDNAPNADGTTSAGHSMPGGTGMAGMDMSQVGDGMQATVHGYTLAAVKAPTKADEAGKLTFRIDGPNGVQKDYTRQQTKLMHAYLVRKDLTGYQHIHPAIDPTTGIWSVDLTIPDPGPYRVITEFEAFTPDGTFDDRILGTDFTVAGTYKPATAEPAALDTASIDGYQLTLDGSPKVGGGDLKLKITKDGADVTALQPYLASFAHITGFREGDLSSVHVHPNEAPKPDDANATGGPELTLSPMFMEAGRYRMFIQFQTGGAVHLVPMDVEVS